VVVSMSRSKIFFVSDEDIRIALFMCIKKQDDKDDGKIS